MRKVTIEILASLISIASALGCFFNAWILPEYFSGKIWFNLSGAILAALSLVLGGRILYRYLQTGSVFVETGIEAFDIAYATDAEIDKQLERFFNQKGEGIVSEVVQKRLESDLRQKIHSGLAEKIDNRGNLLATTTFSHHDVDEHLQGLSESLEVRISQLSSAKSTNLVVGISISIVAIILLSISYLTAEPSSPSNILEFLSIELPRITLAVLIELIGFFFLRMYKSTHNDLKYYQNELTNIRSWSLGFVMASKLGDIEVQKECIRKLLLVERNFLLKSGETTSQLELEKLDSAKNSEIAAMLKDLLSLQSKKQNAE